MAIARPTFILSASKSSGFVFPLNVVNSTSLSEMTPQRTRGILSPQPLLHQEKVSLDDRTPAALTRTEVKLLIDTSRQGQVAIDVQRLWNTIGTAKLHLWQVDDDAFDVLTTSNSESAGAQTIEYAAPAKSWFAVGDYMFLPSNGGGSGNEIVAVTAKTDATPSFGATLVFPHASATVCYRVAMCYPNSVLESIRPSAVPLGKGSLVLSFVTQDVPLFGPTLP